jgi:hypothetical protein
VSADCHEDSGIGRWGSGSMGLALSRARGAGVLNAAAAPVIVGR